MNKLLPAVALAGVLALSACGGSDDTTSAATTSTATSAAGAATASTSAAQASTSAPQASTSTDASSGAASDAASNGATDAGSASSGSPSSSAASQPAAASLTHQELVAKVIAAEKAVKSVHTEYDGNGMVVVQDSDKVAKRSLVTSTRAGKTVKTLSVGDVDYVWQGGKWTKPQGIMFTMDVEGNLERVLSKASNLVSSQQVAPNSYRVVLKSPSGKDTSTATIDIDPQFRVVKFVSPAEGAMVRSQFDRVSVPKP